MSQDLTIEASCRDVLAHVFDVVAVVEADTTIRWVSSSVTQRLGYEADALVGSSSVDLVHSADAERFLDALATELAGEEHARAVTVRVQHATGDWRTAEVLVSNALEVPEVHGIILTIRDVTGARVGERALAADEHLFRTLAMTATDITTITDMEGRRIYISPSVTPMLGYFPDEFAELSTGSFIHPDDLEPWNRAVAEAEDELGGVRRLELRCRDKRGAYRWVEAIAVNLHDDPAVGGLVVHCRDIHDRRQAQDALFFRALHDPLTGLPNRTHLLDHLGGVLAASRREGLGVTVMFCDLDGFKDVNDCHGHHTGDEALNVVAQRVKAAIRPHDFIARFGGDEFCVVSTDFPDRSSAITVAERVRRAIGEPLSLYDAVASVGVSIGIACSQGDPVTGSELIQRADQAMYQAKAAGRDRVHFFEPLGPTKLLPAS